MLIRVVMTLGLLTIWQAIVFFGQLPPYILPGPATVIAALISNKALILQNTIPTLIETMLGLMVGACAGISGALLLDYFRPARLLVLPLLLASQALPTFAIAPLLVIWLGYGMTSKIATTAFMLFFPVLSAFYDGLRATNPEWLALAKVMGAHKWQLLWRLKIPAALPNLASGLRVAVTFAPMGAVIGEWVGSSQGLGFLMLNANARMQIDIMFAALLVLVAIALILYFTLDKLLQLMINY